MPPAEQLNYDLFRHEYETRKAALPFHREYYSIAASGGPQSLNELAELVPFESVAVPLFYLFNDQRNTLFIQALPFVANAFSVYQFHTFFRSIPPSIEEAARLDGAGPWQAFVYVRLPMLWSTLLIAGLFRALDAFRVFDLVYVLTGGGPADSTETLSTLSYKTLFSTLQFGYGSTLSTAMFITEALIAAGFAVFIVRKIGQAR